jgi:cell division protein FtsL
MSVVVRYLLQLLGLWTLAACAAATVIGTVQYRRQMREDARERAEREADEITYARVVEALEVIHVWLAAEGMDAEWAAMNGEGE